jgi:integrase
MTARKPVADGGQRRRRGEGSYTKLSSSGRHQFQLKGDHGFTLKQRAGESFEDFVKRVDKRKADGLAKIKSPANYTFGDCVRDWLDDVVREWRDDEDISPSTYRGYVSIAHQFTRADSPIGKMLMADIIGKDLMDFLKTIRDDRGQRTLDFLLRVAKESVNYAEACNMVDPLTAASIRAATAPKAKGSGRPTVPFSLEQFFHLLTYSEMLWAAERTAVRRGQAMLWPYIALTLLCGVRPEEARGLRWSDVELDEGVVFVQDGGVMRFKGQTKNKSSRRRVRLLDVGVLALRQQAEHQAEQRAAAGELWQESGRVFTDPLGAGMKNHQVRRPFARMCEASGLGTNRVPRETRATFATLMRASGVTVEDIALALGHGEHTETTRAYYLLGEELPPLVDLTPEVRRMVEMAQAASQAAKAALTC